VNYRSHPRPPQLFRPVRPTPLFPSPPLSPLLPAPYSLTYTTATPHLLCNQFVTHSFHHDGGCTPLFQLRTAHPPSNAQKPKFPVVDPHSAQQLTKCSSRNPFLLMTFHFDGGGVPPSLTSHCPLLTTHFPNLALRPISGHTTPHSRTTKDL
jgi:hypothetical protein